MLLCVALHCVVSSAKSSFSYSYSNLSYQRATVVTQNHCNMTNATQSNLSDSCNARDSRNKQTNATIKDAVEAARKCVVLGTIPFIALHCIVLHCIEEGGAVLDKWSC